MQVLRPLAVRCLRPQLLRPVGCGVHPVSDRRAFLECRRPSSPRTARSSFDGSAKIQNGAVNSTTARRRSTSQGRCSSRTRACARPSPARTCNYERLGPGTEMLMFVVDGNGSDAAAPQSQVASRLQRPSFITLPRPRARSMRPMRSTSGRRRSTDGPARRLARRCSTRRTSSFFPGFSSSRPACPGTPRSTPSLNLPSFTRADLTPRSL